MLPELLAYHLTGEVTAELTSAGATGLLDLASGDWSAELADAVGSAPQLCCPTIRPPGTLVGKWRDVPVHLVGGHDTASAVLGGAAEGAAFVSAGTWLLVGRMLARPDTSEAARLARFSNEQGAAGGIRLLRNVAGWWLVEECRRSWGDPTLDELLDEAARVGPVPAADATDERFLAPADMAAELVGGGRARAPRVAGRRSSAVPSSRWRSRRPPSSPSSACRACRCSAAGRDRRCCCTLLAEHVDGAVTVGPVEATALGNAMSQGLALGVFGSVAEGRRTLCEPQSRAKCERRGASRGAATSGLRGRGTQ